MKLFYLLPTLFLSGLALDSAAQAISIGPRIGLNMSKMAVEEYNTFTPLGKQAVADFDDNQDWQMAPQGGIMVNIGFDDNFSLQPEFNYAVKGVKVGGQLEGLNRDHDIKLNYLEIPVLFKATTGTENFKASILAGPYFAHLLGGTDKYTLTGDPANSYDGDIQFEFRKEQPWYHYNHFDLGGTLGIELGYKTNMGTFLVDARYNAGVKEVITYHPDLAETSLRLTNRTIGISLGWLYHFPFTPKVKSYDGYFDDEEVPANTSPTPNQSQPQQ